MVDQQDFCGSHGCDEGHVISEGEADRLSKITSNSLRQAIEEELRHIIGKGVSINTLLEISRFSHAAQELLMIRSPIAEVRRKKKRNNGSGLISFSDDSNLNIGNYGTPGGFAMSPYQGEYGYGQNDTDVDSLTNEAAQNETFGAKLTREIVSALGAMKRQSGPSIPELIDSIKQARDAGLDSVAARLEESLDEALGRAQDEDPPPTSSLSKYPVPGILMPMVDVQAMESPDPTPDSITQPSLANRS